jgi:hypothetical protein
MYEPVKKAFDAGMAAAKTVNPNVLENRAGRSNLKNIESLWGLYGANDFILEWKLPIRVERGGPCC